MMHSIWAGGWAPATLGRRDFDSPLRASVRMVETCGRFKPACMEATQQLISHVRARMACGDRLREGSGLNARSVGLQDGRCNVCRKASDSGSSRECEYPCERRSKACGIPKAAIGRITVSHCEVFMLPSQYQSAVYASLKIAFTGIVGLLAY